MNKLTPEQALNNLYLASRRAPLTAEEHEVCNQSAKILLDEIKITKSVEPKEDKK